MTKSYHNPWMPAETIRILENEQGTILDVGGGAAPYYRADHIVDVQPFDAERLTMNAWGGEAECGGMGVSEWRSNEERRLGAGQVQQPETPIRRYSHTPSPLTWTASQYTQLDLCDGQKWPFEDKQFDLGLCSHCLEDLRDPLPAVRELSRVCKRVLIITPSRLLEQTIGIDHPRYCGFYHHPWMVFQENNKLIFRRKTPIVNLPACHIVCPIGMTLQREQGAALFYGADMEAEERMYWSERDDYEDYCRFIEPYRGRQDLFVRDPRQQGLKYRLWRFRQKYSGAV